MKKKTLLILISVFIIVFIYNHHKNKSIESEVDNIEKPQVKISKESNLIEAIPARLNVKLSRGEKKYFKVKLKNNSDAKIIIDTCRGTCPTCTKIKNIPKEIKPHEEHVLDVTIDSLGLTKKPFFKKAIFLTFNKANSKTTQIKSIPIIISQNIAEGAIPVLTSINKKTDKSSENISFFELKNVGKEDLIIEEILCPNFIKFSISKKSIKSGEKAEIEISKIKNINSSNNKLNVSSVVLITNNTENYPAVSIPVVDN